MTSEECLGDLLDRSLALDRRASRIQGDREARAGSSEIEQLIGAYQDWYAECLGVLPEDLRDRFRAEYEGSWYSPKIKAFLQAPTERSVLFDEAEPSELISYWQHPYETIFHAPALAQQQILREAAQHARAVAKGAGPARELMLIEQVLRNFSAFLSPLQRRQRSRPGFVVEDEYDVQDLLNGVLRLFFDDVRPEEWTPSYAGGSSRIDFLVKRERIVVEAKMTRSSLRDRQLGDELIIDKERYRAHPDCDILIAFIYDPRRLVQNPRGFEDDLTEDGADFVTRVYIVH